MVVRTTAPLTRWTCEAFRGGQPAPAPTHTGELARLLDDQTAFVWLDIAAPTAGDMDWAQRTLGIHPLAIDDALQAHQRGKIQAYSEGDGAYWFMVVHPVTLENGRPTTHEVALFAGRRYILTLRSTPPLPLDEVHARWRQHQGQGPAEAGFLLYTLLDTIVDGYFPVADWFEERVNAIEARLFEPGASRQNLTREIFNMKKDSQRFRHAAWPIRDILSPVVRGDLGLYPEAERTYFRDVYDHAVRVVDQVDATRDLANSALDVQLAVTANRQNEVSKQLTIIATIFLPLTFITGFFGQNFSVLVKFITGPAVFWLLGIASEVLAAVFFLAFFRRRGWF